MTTTILQRPYIPGIGKDAKKLGVSRQFLSRVLHDPERYGHYQIYKDYHNLKRGSQSAR